MHLSHFVLDDFVFMGWIIHNKRYTKNFHIFSGSFLYAGVFNIIEQVAERIADICLTINRFVQNTDIFVQKFLRLQLFCKIFFVNLDNITHCFWSWSTDSISFIYACFHTDSIVDIVFEYRAYCFIFI